MKQTAVEWLREKLQLEFGFIFSDNILEKAKEMEEEQIENAWQNAIENCGEFNNPTIISADQYYNETYESK